MNCKLETKKACIFTLTSIILTNGMFAGTSNTLALANIRNTTSIANAIREILEWTLFE